MVKNNKGKVHLILLEKVCLFKDTFFLLSNFRQISMPFKRQTYCSLYCHWCRFNSTMNITTPININETRSEFLQCQPFKFRQGMKKLLWKDCFLSGTEQGQKWSSTKRIVQVELQLPALDADMGAMREWTD